MNVIFNFVSGDSNDVADFCSHYTPLGDFYWDSFFDIFLPISIVDLIRKD